MKKGDAKKGLALLDRMSSGRDFDDIDNTPIEMPFGARRPETPRRNWRRRSSWFNVG